MYTETVVRSTEPDKHPQIVALFDVLYRVSIPTRMMQSMEEQRMFGTRAVGDIHIDRALLSERTVTWLSIAGMCEHFKDGVNVAVIDPADCKKIYESINSHLETWAGYIRRAVNMQRVPFEELILMDKFASAVYKHARYQQGNSPYASLFMENLSKQVRMGPMTMFKRPILMTNARTAFEQESFKDDFIAGEAEHESMQDMLKAASMRKRRV